MIAHGWDQSTDKLELGMKRTLAIGGAAVVATGMALTMSPGLALLSSPAFAEASKAPAGAKEYFINPKDGETVSNPIRIQFGLSGMGVAPAGLQGDATANTGHHHLLIDTKLTPEALKQPLPSDKHHMHFGKGQTEATITLPPGKHTLQLVLGDWSHVPFDPLVASKVITIDVK